MVSDPVVIVGISRTAMGGMNGVFANVPAPVLGGQAIKGAIADANLSLSEVDEVLMGCVLAAAVGQAPARQAALNAGLAHTIPCTTVNKVCGSGMKTVTLAHDAIVADAANIVVAGGMENMTRAPHMLTKARAGYRLGHGELLDHMFLDGLQDAYSGELMGVFAEATAAKYGFTREQQDAFSIHSLSKAEAAIQANHFLREMTPLTVSSKKQDVVIAEDEQPGNAKPNKIATLRPAFQKNGTVTAANSSSIADGAAALVLMRQSDALARELKPLAVIKAHSQYAHSPEWFTTAPVGAVQSVLKKAGWCVADVDLFEVNEAFAVVTMALMEELAIPVDKVNVHGGACALGHPLGASGARILVTLIAAMQTYSRPKGVASLCIGGGEAMAIAVELYDKSHNR